MRSSVVVLSFLFAAVELRAVTIPEAEAIYAPTVQRLAAVHAAAKPDGWLPQVAVLRAAAMTAYERDKLQAAEAWFHVYRWAQLFGRTEAEFIPAWIDAVNAAQVGHSGMTVPTAAGQRPLGAMLPSDVQAWMMGNAAFSTEFFALLSPVDYVPRVFEILAGLHRRDPARFKTFAGLALAIAVVYDVTPPTVWPHGQVPVAALPRQLPAPADAFAWWIKQEQSGRLYHRLSRLTAGELKFVVDTAAPFPELEWAQRSANHPLSHLVNAYSMIRYRKDRANASPIWSGPTYRLADILAAGGICADQAYFATQVGKARGVPTLLFHGAGNDGRHAWFGYLDGSRTWRLDAGRYAEQRFVTGLARDPQTWREFTDHELQFLTERFRELPSFRQSRVHASFAADFLVQGRAPLAAAAARKAVNFERRNQAAWETLVAAARAEGKDAKIVENLLREAALAFNQRYPDLEAHYVNRVAESLRARGQTSAAQNEVRRIALKNQGTRSDLSVQQARDIVRRAVAQQPLPEQVRTYNTVVDTYGRGAGIAFFDQVVVGFVEHLMGLGQKAEAVKAVERARRALKVESNSQLATELERMAKALRAAK